MGGGLSHGDGDGDARDALRHAQGRVRRRGRQDFLRRRLKWQSEDVAIPRDAETRRGGVRPERHHGRRGGGRRRAVSGGARRARRGRINQTTGRGGGATGRGGEEEGYQGQEEATTQEEKGEDRALILTF